MSWCHDSRDEIPTLNVSRVVWFMVEILGRSDIPHDLLNVRINTVSTISQRRSSNGKAYLQLLLLSMQRCWQPVTKV